MGKIIKRLTLTRPPEEIYDFILDPIGFQLIPGVREVKKEGDIYWLKGQEKVPLLGLEAVNYRICIDEKRRPIFIRFHTEDFISPTQGCYRIHEMKSKSLLEYELEYKVPGAFLGKVIDRLLMEKQMEKESEIYLDNIEKMIRPVKEIMTEALITIEKDEKIASAVKKMDQSDKRYLPVIDKKKLLVGVITDGDILNKVYHDGLSPDETTVEEAMTQDLVTIKSLDNISNAIGLMQKNKIRRLPVVDKKSMVGLISMTDLEHYFEIFSH